MGNPDDLHTNPEQYMTYNCIWDLNGQYIKMPICGEKATWWFIGGCLDQHIHHYPLCALHTARWLECQRETRVICDKCGRPIEEYEVTPTHKVVKNIIVTH